MESAMVPSQSNKYAVNSPTGNDSFLWGDGLPSILKKKWTAREWTQPTLADKISGNVSGGKNRGCDFRDRSGAAGIAVIRIDGDGGIAARRIRLQFSFAGQ